MTETRVKSLEIWDQGLEDGIALTRKSSVHTWTPGVDGEEAYLKNINDKRNAHHVTYAPQDIEYKYNAYGYRSDEFDTPCDVLYAGCSFTEGIALPLDHVWGKQLNKMIEDKYDVKLNYHTVSRGGASTTGIVRRIYAALEVLKLRPKMVLALFPSVFRAEFYTENFSTNSTPHDYVPNYLPQFGDKETRLFYEFYERNIRITNTVNNFYRDVILANSICEQHGVKFRFSSWQGPVRLEHMADDDITNMPHTYKMFHDEEINIDQIIFDYMPKHLVHKYLQNAFQPAHPPGRPVFPQTVGRDFMHPGPNLHHGFATRMLDFLKPDLKELYENN